MNRLWKSMIVVFLFLMGTASLFITQANPSDNFARPVALSNDQRQKITAESERETAALPINGEVRKKGLPVGLWGGEHISMEVNERHTTIEYDCAHATIDQRIILDRRGRFDVSGMQVPEHGGPVRQDDQPNGYPVRFAGQVSGKSMKLSVRNTATKEKIGTFTLVYGSEPRLRKCR